MRSAGTSDAATIRRSGTPTAHWRETGHPIIRSFEPREEWFWDYRLEAMVDGPPLAPPQSHPASQGVPGPRDRVPRDWRGELEALRASEASDEA